jgi:transposase
MVKSVVSITAELKKNNSMDMNKEKLTFEVTDGIVKDMSVRYLEMVDRFRRATTATKTKMWNDYLNFYLEIIDSHTEIKANHRHLGELYLLLQYPDTPFDTHIDYYLERFLIRTNHNIIFMGDVLDVDNEILYIEGKLKFTFGKPLYKRLVHSVSRGKFKEDDVFIHYGLNMEHNENIDVMNLKRGDFISCHVNVSKKTKVSSRTKLFYFFYLCLMRLKRYIHLDEHEEQTVYEGSVNARHPQFKDRCHCVYLSSKQYDMDTLADIFSVSKPTIGNWLSSWETHGIMGLYNAPGQGRKSILTDADKALVKAQVQATPQELKVARLAIQSELNKEFSEKTLRRFLKSLVGRLGDVGEKV